MLGLGTRVARWQALSALLALTAACSTTPLDALQQWDESTGGADGTAGAASLGGAGGVPGAGDSCLVLDTEPWMRSYSIRARATGNCLRSGAETTLVGVPPAGVTPYLVDTEGACDLPAWRFAASTASTGAWKIASTEIEGHTMDVETASTIDGTRVILYTPALATNGHQRFFVRQRASNIFQITPLHAQDLCFTNLNPGLEIWRCDNKNAAQEWELLYDTCNMPIED